MQLQQGKTYRLKYTGQLCHLADVDNVPIDRLEIKHYFWKFIGTISTTSGQRNIFFTDDRHSSKAVYLMFSDNDLDYVVEEVMDLKDRINKVINSISTISEAIQTIAREIENLEEK